MSNVFNMKIEFLHKTGMPGMSDIPDVSGISGKGVMSREAVIFFGGWGSGAELFRDCVFPEDKDVILCCDYRNLHFNEGILDFPYEMLRPYGTVILYAWSMGVYVASAFKTGMQKYKENTPDFHSAVTFSTAINGTETPVSDDYGIPEAIFKGTLEEMSQRTLTKFRRRMCGHNLEYFMEHVPSASADELKDELQSLFDMVMEHGVLRSRWDAAICSGGDLIFPFASQKACWDSLGVDVTVVDDAHYCPSVFAECLAGKLMASTKSKH